MIRDTRFWLRLAIAEVIFGAAVFALTRAYYLQPIKDAGAPPPIAEAPITWPEGMSESFASQLGGSSEVPVTQDPIEISRLADEYFSRRQYEQAASLYERLLTFGPNNADVLNNLGLTLHYLGRSGEALSRLDEGIAADPGNQRIWLTLGFVNSQLGNIDEARKALTTATEIGTDESVRVAATKMLEALP